MLNDLYNKELAAARDKAFIVESVLGDDITDTDEDGVDVEGVPMSAIQQADAAFDTIISRADYDDTDIEDLMDDDDEFAMLITEATNTMCMDMFIEESTKAIDQFIAESAAKDANVIKASKMSKDAIALYKEAKKLVKTDKAAASAKAKEAIKMLEQLKIVVKDVPDDTQAELILRMVIKAILPISIAYVLIMVPSTVAVALATVSMILGSIGLIHESLRYDGVTNQTARKLKKEGDTDLTKYISTNISMSLDKGVSRSALMEKYDKMIDTLKTIVNPNDISAKLAKYDTAKA